jgi:hypothetical protein
LAGVIFDDERNKIYRLLCKGNRLDKNENEQMKNPGHSNR